MPDQTETQLDSKALFAAVALHRLLVGSEDPEHRFSQVGDGYNEVCREAWEIADRMVKARPPAASEASSTLNADAEADHAG